jgi:putative transposase
MELESGPKKDGRMKRGRVTEEQIIEVLKEHEAGAKTAYLARKHGISEATINSWKAKLGGMDVSEARRLRALEEEKREAEEASGRAFDAAASRESR